MRKIAYHVISVDLSTTKLSVVVTNEKGVVKEVSNYMLVAHPQRRYHEAYRVGRNLAMKYKRLGMVYAFPERPIAWRSSRATLALAGIAACLMAGFTAGKADVVIEANNQTWKKDVVGDGGAGKPKISKYILQQWPSMYEHVRKNFKCDKEGRPDQDLMDSACINIYGQQIIERKIKMQGEDFAVIKTLRKKKRSA